MENDISGWLSYANEVEADLKGLGDMGFSKSYKNQLLDLLDQIRTEASLLTNLSIIEKQESYIRINALGSELKSAAYFAN